MRIVETYKIDEEILSMIEDYPLPFNQNRTQTTTYDCVCPKKNHSNRYCTVFMANSSRRAIDIPKPLNPRRGRR